MSTIIESLLDLPSERKPDTKKVYLPRLNLEITLQEVSFNTMEKLRSRTEDRSLHYLLASVSAPDLKDKAWYQEHMGCVTPVDALKKLLKKGEVEKLCQAADSLNGYSMNSVLVSNEGEDALFAAAVSKALEELKKK